MLFYAKRLELYRRFLEWANDTKSVTTCKNLIAFLSAEGLIDEDMVMDYLRKKGEKGG